MEAQQLYPNDGSFFGINAPEEQVREEEREKAEVVSATPQLNSVIEYLDKQIATYSSIDGIDESVLAEPDKFMHVIAANKIVVANLIVVKDGLELLIKEYK